MGLLLEKNTGKPIMTNEEFDLLKENLLWEGSKIAIMSKDEMVRKYHNQ